MDEEIIKKEAEQFQALIQGTNKNKFIEKEQREEQE
jgi:hypothetical protein